MNTRQFFILSTIVVVFLTACNDTNIQDRFPATQTIEPTESQVPKPRQTQTLTPIPTPTQTPAPTPIPIPMGEIVRVYIHSDLCSAPVSYCSALKVFLEEERVEILTYEGRDWYKVKAKGLTEESPPIIGYLLKNSIKFAAATPTPGK